MDLNSFLLLIDIKSIVWIAELDRRRLLFFQRANPTRMNPFMLYPSCLVQFAVSNAHELSRIGCLGLGELLRIDYNAVCEDFDVSLRDF